MSKKEKDSHLLSIRINSHLNKEIEDIAKELKINKSTLIKQAFNEWSITRNTHRDRHMILISRPFFSFILSEVKDEKIVEFAHRNGERFVNLFKIRAIKEDIVFDIEFLLEELRGMLCLSMFNWFDIFDFKMENKKSKIQIYGLHNMERKFSLYNKELIEFIVTKSFPKFELKPTSDTVMENGVYLIFES